ncbi:hypothetical protein [Paenibacillus sp.]|jgi:hypothetical protein|uniref:hypothetical protein n=1 Tax=Paenibacillus sp. TaxID=58172 RepID=UPI002822C626|nr:hypothetical protein [Paenibacillus sp.]MDR0268181.1 hypothetical protein [Paenibacillus sp.]
MRLEQGTTAGWKVQEPKLVIRRQLEYTFELGQEQDADQPNKSKGTGGKLVTCREGGYIRQYIVRADGSRILLSEMKEPKSDAASLMQTDNEADYGKQEDSMGQSTEDVIQLLNVQAGIAADYRKKTVHLTASYNTL